MENKFREKQQKNYTVMRMTYDIAMGLLILGIGAVMFFGDKWGIEVVQGLDPLMKNLFSGLCLLYGGFRMYRGIKHEY